jgi:hypothetical protein
MKPKITALEVRNSPLSVTLDGELPDRPPPFTTSILRPALLVHSVSISREGLHPARDIRWEKEWSEA